ncbi:MAG: hypothetical protein CR993_04640 [Rhodobacterales bacterium]|nr:MAG: hypothetical protein CR993_04640 [Rhodobacterales bacterium]
MNEDYWAQTQIEDISPVSANAIIELEKMMGAKLQEEYKRIISTYRPFFLEKSMVFDIDWIRIDGRTLSIEEGDDFEK